MAGVRPAALELLPAGLDDPTHLAAHLDAAGPADRRHPAQHDEPATHFPELMEVNPDIREHLVRVLEPRPDPVVPVVAQVAFNPGGQERMPFTGRMPDRRESVRVARIEAVSQLLELLVIAIHGV